MAFVLLSTMKNEAPFILEWVAYHRAIGFDRIKIVPEESDDGTTDLLDALAGQGIIDPIAQTVPADTSPQANAARLSGKPTFHDRTALFDLVPSNLPLAALSRITESYLLPA
jgi:hypothetical protein